MYLLLLIWMFVAGIVQNDDWHFEYEKEGISVYTLQVENSSFKAFRGEMETDIPMEQLVGLISDIERYPDCVIAPPLPKFSKMKTGASITTTRVLHHWG